MHKMRRARVDKRAAFCAHSELRGAFMLTHAVHPPGFRFIIAHFPFLSFSVRTEPLHAVAALAGASSKESLRGFGEYAVNAAKTCKWHLLSTQFIAISLSACQRPASD